MSHRIVNVSKPQIVVCYSNAPTLGIPVTSSPVPTKISQMIDALKGKKGTVTVSAGVYQENVTLPDGVNLIGNGTIKIIGSLTAQGEGLLSFVDVDGLVVKGKRMINNCNVSVLTVQSGAYANCRNSQITRIDCTKGQFSVTNCTIGKALVDYTISLRDGVGLVETSTIEGSSRLGANSVLDCKHSSIIGTDDLFETENETTTLQLFNCVVYGDKLIKSGPGTSIRSNVTALSDAVAFEGGENVKIESI